MLYVDCLSAGGLNHAHGVVAVLEISAFSALFLYDFRAGDGFGIHGDDIVHFVSAVDVDELTCRTHAVGGVNIAAVLFVKVEAPVALVFVPEVLEVVDV